MQQLPLWLFWCVRHEFLCREADFVEHNFPQPCLLAPNINPEPYLLARTLSPEPCQLGLTLKSSTLPVDPGPQPRLGAKNRAAPDETLRSGKILLHAFDTAFRQTLSMPWELCTTPWPHFGIPYSPLALLECTPPLGPTCTTPWSPMNAHHPLAPTGDFVQPLGPLECTPPLGPSMNAGSSWTSAASCNRCRAPRRPC